MIRPDWLAQIKVWESGPRGGPALDPYLCPAHYWTIGYGATTGLDGKPVTAAHARITPDLAEALLVRDLGTAERGLDRTVQVRTLSQGQREALIDFIFNLGVSRFRASTLLRYVLALKDGLAADEFPKWVHGGGRRLPGLVIRRTADRARFERERYLS